MKKKTGFLPLLLAALFCFGLLAGCGASTDEEEVSDSTASESPAVSDDGGGSAGDEETDGEDSTEQGDLIGEITQVDADGTLTLSLYQADGEITDYTLLDGVTLTDTGETATVTPEEDAVYERVTDGVLESAAQEDLAPGDFIAVTENEEGGQTILILDYTAAGESDETDETSETDDSTASDIAAA